MVNNYLIEICIGNIEDAIKASKFPIDRIELNSALELGGLSTSLETLKYLKKTIPQPICCMVRPRGGDFFYNETEYQIMLKDAKAFLEAGADGIVFGFLNEDKTINKTRTKEMTDLIHSYGKEAVFHKAYDETPNMEQATKELVELEIDRVLTSGQAVYPDIIEGCRKINTLNEKYGDRLQFLPGGGVRIENVQDVLKTAKTNQIHMTSKKQNPGGYLEFDSEQLEKILNNIKKL